MKQDVFDVLVYLFENYISQTPESGADRESLAAELGEAGFHKGEIDKAFNWFEGLSVLRESRTGFGLRTNPAGNFRYYTSIERERLGAECRGLLVSMENSGVLDAATREIVVDRAMALGGELTLEQLKWVILLVLHDQPGRERAFPFLEDLVLERPQNQLH